MIPLTPDEIRLLVEARDLLASKLREATPRNDLWLKEGYNGMLQVLKHSIVDVS